MDETRTLIQQRTVNDDPANRFFAVSARVKHSLGLLLLLLAVLLFTTSNFLVSSIFANDTFDKPFFVTYLNSFAFALTLIPRALHSTRTDFHTLVGVISCKRKRGNSKYYIVEQTAGPVANERGREEEEVVESEDSDVDQPLDRKDTQTKALTNREYARLGSELCALWFIPNYFIAACLAHTTVASATILTSTGSIFVLILSSLFRISRLTLAQIFGVLLSLVGVALVSTTDVTTKTPARPTDTKLPWMAGGDILFAHKSKYEIALGDAMALIAALTHAVYTIWMHHRVRAVEARGKSVNIMRLFGVMGVMNIVVWWPGFALLDWIEWETWGLPPNGKLWTFVTLNALVSLLIDFTWLHAMLLTTPIVSTVGMRLTIPLSLVVQIIMYRQFVGLLYWVGAALVCVSFGVIYRDSAGR